MSDKIITNGLYDLAMDAYHGDCCAAPSLSASGIVTLDQRPPAVFWSTSYLNPDHIGGPETDALVFGRAAHKMILEGHDAFKSEFSVAPADLSLATKDGKAWKAECAASGRTAIKAEAYDTLRGMAKAMKAHPLVRGMFAPGAPEKSIIWKDEETGVWLKARPDWLPSAQAPNGLWTVPNYKTARDATRDGFSRDAFAHGYHIGAALTLEGLRVVCGVAAPAYYFIAQEKEPPFLVGIYTMGEDDMAIAQAQIRRALRLFARCLERNEWPGLTPTPVGITMPGWMRKQLTERGDNERLAQDNSMEEFAA